MHTQGPWRVEARTNAHFSVLPDRTGWSPEVAYCHKLDDARLIAAAPELLEALQFAKDWFENQGMSFRRINEALAKVNE